MANLYSIDVMICATAYFRADTPDDALRMARELDGYGFELAENEYSDPPVTGRRFDDPELRDVSLSPAVTLKGPVSMANIELQAEDVPDYDDGEPAGSYRVEGHTGFGWLALRPDGSEISPPGGSRFWSTEKAAQLACEEHRSGGEIR